MEKGILKHQDKAFPGQGIPIDAELALLRRELADVKMEREFKKNSDHFQQGSEMKYQFIFNYSETFPVGKMSSTLDIPLRRFYHWSKGIDDRKQKENRGTESNF